jgi:hypothetical protein
MAEEKVNDASLPAGLGQSPIARRAGAVGKGSAGREPRERQNTGGDPETAERGGGRFGLGAGIRPQSVVDDEGLGPPALGLRPMLSEKGERQAIGPAGNRQSQKRAASERTKRPEQRAEFRCRNRRLLVAVAVLCRQQPSLLCWAAMGPSR